MKKSHAILQALADAPEGLLTSDVAATIDDGVSNVSALLSYLANAGRVERTRGGAGAGEATWCITDFGRDYISALLEDEPRPARPAAPAAAPPPVSTRPPAKAPRNGSAVPPIEPGIEIPGVRKALVNRYVALAQRMKPGDSVAFERPGPANSLSSAIRKIGGKATRRLMDDRTHRVWRTA
jgi:hypothetical protein